MRAAAFGALVWFASSAAAAAPAPQPAPGATATPAIAGPCGVVAFIPVSAPRYIDGTAIETMRATVSFPDGYSATAQFPYPWVYPDGERTDPWSNTNLRRPNFAVTMQLPPAGTDVKTLPPLIRYIVEHTDAAGYTSLVGCPARAGGEAAHPFFAPAPVTPPAQPLLLPFVDVTANDSPVKVIDATLFSRNASGRAVAGAVRECVTFWNRARQPVTAIRFTFTSFDPAGSLAAVRTLERSAPVGAGVVVEGIRRDRPAVAIDPRNCRTSAWSGELGRLEVAVTEVAFADGSTWTPGPHPAVQR